MFSLTIGLRTNRIVYRPWVRSILIYSPPGSPGVVVRWCRFGSCFEKASATTILRDFHHFHSFLRIYTYIIGELVACIPSFFLSLGSQRSSKARHLACMPLRSSHYLKPFCQFSSPAPNQLTSLQHPLSKSPSAFGNLESVIHVQSIYIYVLILASFCLWPRIIKEDLQSQGRGEG